MMYYDDVVLISVVSLPAYVMVGYIQSEIVRVEVFCHDVWHTYAVPGYGC